MRRTMMTDQQYNALVASRSRGPSGVSSQLLTPAQGAQYLSRKLYADMVYPYHPAAVGSGLTGSAVPYPPPSNRAAADNYPDPQDVRAQLAVERRGGGLLPSPALVDYSSQPFVDPIGSRGVLSAPRISPEVVGSYTSHYPSPQRGGLPLSNAELLAARARRSELYPGGYVNEVPARRIPAASSYDELGLFPGSAAGILGPGGVTRGRELDRYLLSVQPEKLVGYATSVLAPDPAVRRNDHPIISNNLNPEDDRYSNYRRGKARRTGSHEFGGDGEPRSQRDRERDIYRDREEDYRERRGGESGRERGKRSPDRRQTNGSLSRSKDASRVDRRSNASQSSGGRRGEQNGGQNKRSRESEKLGKAGGAKGKVENPNSDQDSELGSLCADLSDSDEEKVEKKSEEAATVIDGPLAGMIFGCSSATFHECMKLQLFGLPAKNKENVMRVTPGTKVFLFNFDTKELSGIFEAISHGGWQIQPDAFRDFGGFPAQVQVCCSEQCPNIPQSLFKPAIKENYVNSTRFRFDLNAKQVRELVRMFRQAARNLPRQQQEPMADRYLGARLPPEDYLARGGPQQQRPYARHPQARFGTSRVVPYDDARVMMISMSASKTPTNFRKKSKRRASKRAQLKKGRKKRKVSSTNKPESPPPPILADNCILYSLSGEIQEEDDVAVNARWCADDGTSNPNNAVIVFREGIDTGSSRNVDHQPKEIVETPPAAKGIVPPSGLSPSKPPEEFPQPQSDLGKQEVSFREDDSYNDGNFRLAGSRADEQGQGLGLDVPHQGALSSGNLRRSSGYTLSSMGEDLCSEAQGDFSTKGPAEPLVKLGGNKAPSTTDGDGQLSKLGDEKTSREGFGDIGVAAHDKTDNSGFISSEFGTGGKHMDEVLMETVQDEADCTLSSAGKGEELEAIAAEFAIGPEAPCVSEEVMVAADVAICPAAPCIREEVMVTAEVAMCPAGPSVREEVMVDAEVAMCPAAPCVREEVIVDAEVAICPEAPCVREEVMVAADSEAPLVIEEVMITSRVVGKHEELSVIAANVARDSQVPVVIEEVTTASAAVSKDDELELIATMVAVDPEAPIIIEEVMNASEVVGEDDELEVIPAEVAVDPKSPVVIEEVMNGSSVVGKDEEVGVVAAEVAIDSEAPCVREEVVIAVEAVDKDEELEVIAGVAINSETAIDRGAPYVREEAMIAAEAVAQDGTLQMIADEFAIDSEAPVDREEVMINAEAVGNDEELEVIAAEVPCVREEVVIAARTLSSQLLASADMDDMLTTVHDEDDQGEVVILPADAVDSDQPPSPGLNVVHGDDEDEEELLPADNAVDCDPATSPDEDEDEEGKDEEGYDYDYGEEDVSVDGELSNGGEDGDDDEDIGFRVDMD